MFKVDTSFLLSIYPYFLCIIMQTSNIHVRSAEVSKRLEFSDKSISSDT